MPCLNCGSPNTIRAHLMPRVFATEVQSGKAHAANVRPDGSFTYSQSGLWDADILCSTCDGLLGAHEHYASQSFADIRRLGLGKPVGVYDVPSLEAQRILRFLAGLLWKYGVARKDLGRIHLGPYQKLLGQIAFHSEPSPPSFDAVLLRLTLGPDDESVFAYRAPHLDRKSGVNVYRLMVGGLLVFVRVDSSSPSYPPFDQLWLNSTDTPRFSVQPAQLYEEFRILERISSSSPKLSAFLDKQASW